MIRRLCMCTALVALALAGCDDGNGDGADGGATPDEDGGTMARDDAGPPLMGDASLSFSPTWGDAQQQFQGLNWQAILDLNLFQPAIEEHRDTRVVIMLCPSGDTTCESPALIREITEDETDGDPIQDSFGPEIVATGLPAGTWELMIFADTGVSRFHGLSWEDDFETSETAWGGVVSELDVMLSDEDAAMGFTPPPVTMQVTLTDGETAEVGTVTLQHVHERDISPDPNPEPGTLAVAVAEGLRLIDTSTHELIEVDEGSGFYTREMVDAGGSPFAGTVCGMIDGPDDTVFLMYQDEGVGAGFAVQYDVGADEQMHGGNRIVFGDAGLPCRGRYHDGYLYVTNASASRLNRPEASAGENLWFAEVSGLSGGDVTATLLDRTVNEILQHGVDSIAGDGSTLYMTINGDNTVGGLPSECITSYCVFRATIGGDGTPVLDDGSGFDFWVGPEIGESYPTPMGDVTCVEESSPWAPIEVADFHDGRTLLFLGACLEVAVFDTADGSELDLNAAPGVQGLDGTVFGFAFNAFAMSPDGATLWALPQRPSPVHFYFAGGVDENRVTFNRYMAYPIDLSSGDDPALDAAYTGTDLDGYEGMTNIGPYQTPADDPGVDINVAWYTEYRHRLLSSTAGFQPAAIPNGPSLVATNDSLWVRGAGNAEAGASGLGKAGNLSVYDLETRRMILFPYDDAGFYRFWHGGADPEPLFGYDLTPGMGDTIATFGLRWVPGT